MPFVTHPKLIRSIASILTRLPRNFFAPVVAILRIAVLSLPNWKSFFIGIKVVHVAHLSGFRKLSFFPSIFL